MAESGKKKSKFKTVSLNEFLSDEKGKAPSFVPATSSWADEMDNQEVEGELLILKRYTVKPVN